MKKLLSVLLMAAMLLCCVSAFAEAQKSEVVPAYKVITTVPEGYEAGEELWINPFIVATTLKPTTEGKPAMMLMVSYNDAYSDITFNADMSDEDFKARVDVLTVDEETGEQTPYTVQETGLGTKVVVINDPDGYTEFYSIWHGYEVSLMCANFDENKVPTPLTEEQLAVIMQYLTDMDFQKVIEEVEAPAV